jgi:hypothetical protein
MAELTLFQTRAMLRQLEILKPPQSFLRNWFPETVQSNSEFVDIDVYKGKRRLAPFVSPQSQGKVTNRERYTTRTIKPPYIKMKRATEAADTLQRAMGENPFSGRSPQQRAAEILAQDLREMVWDIERREEWMRAQLLMTGKFTLVGEGFDQLDIDMLQDAGNQFTTGEITATWDNTSTARPIKDFRDMNRVIVQKTGKSARDVVMGIDAFDAFVKTDEVQDEINLRRINGNAFLNSVSDDMGATLHGDVGGFRIWTYNEWYLDESDVEQPMIPAKKLFMAPQNLRAANHYAAIQDLEVPGGNAALRFWPKTWTEPDPSVRWLMIQSAPMPAIHEIDGVVNATVLA